MLKNRTDKWTGKGQISGHKEECTKNIKKKKERKKKYIKKKTGL